MPQNPELLALRLREAKEQARVWEAHRGIKGSPPGPERERQRSLYDRAFEALQRAGEALSLWWLGQPKTFDEEDEMDFAEASGAVREGLLDLGYSYPIQTSRAKRRHVQVVYHAPDGTKHTGKVRFHEVDEWLAGLPEPPEPDLDALARDRGKAIVNGELVELPENEEAKVSIEESVKDKQHLTDEEREALAPLMNGVIAYPNGKPTFVPLDEGEDPQEAKERMEAKVEEKELPPLEKEPVQEKEEPVVEIKVNSILAVLKQARDNGTTVLVNYRNQDGTAKGRLIKVIAISKDEKKFNVYDGDSGQVRKGWFTESVLQAYPSVTDIGKYANRIQDYGKEGHTAAVSPVAGNALTRKWGKTHFTTPEQAERLVATGNWVRLV